MKGARALRSFALRHPLVFSILVLTALILISVATSVAVPSAPIGDVSDISSDALKPPSPLQQAITSFKDAGNLFWIMAILLAAGLLAVLGWWREAGFGTPRWGKLYLLVFPLAVCAFALSDGFLLPGAGPLAAGILVVLIAALGEEAIFRGLLWRAFIPSGPMWTIIVTSLLTGALYLARSTTDVRSEAIRLAITATCAAFMYGALRWRLASIWPVGLIHAALAYTPTISVLGSTKYPILVWISTLGFVLYGLFLLRSRRVRADGG